MKKVTILLLAALVLVGCATPPEPRGLVAKPTPMEKPDGEEGETPMSFTGGLKDYLGDDLMKLIPLVDRVESYQIANRKGEAKDNLAGYPVLAKGRDLTADQVATLKTLLLDDKTYVFGSAKKMPFLPKLALKAVAGDRSLVILFMPEGLMLAIPHDGKSWIEDYDPVKSQIEALLGSLF